MRRWRTSRGRSLLLVTGMVAAVMLPAPAVLADAVVLAVEDTGQETGEDTGGEAPGEQEEGQMPGPEPDPETTFAPSDYERNWTWWIGVILTAFTAIAIAGIGVAYYVLVDREESA